MSTVPDFYGFERTRVTKVPTWLDDSPIPWMTYAAINYLQQIDFSARSIFEYGAGSSTEFWARHAARVVSVEHDPEWFGKIQAKGIPNAAISLATGGAYVEAITSGAPHDVIVVDVHP